MRAHKDMSTPTIPGYRIVRSLSEANRANVYLAEQQSLQRLVALKVLSFEMSDNEASRRRVIEEGKAAARLTHPNLLSVFDIGEADGRHYIATEYVSGGTMRDRLSNGALEIDKVLSIARDLATGLKFLHSQGFLHRDIKPTNVFFREDGTALLGEAGVARAVSGKTPENEQVAFGSPHYMSPERAQALPSDGRSDQYSLAVVIWEALTGKPPFDADDPFQVAIKHISEPVPALPLAFAVMQPILGRCLAKQPEQRFANTAELLSAIEQLVAARATSGQTSSTKAPSNPLVAQKPVSSSAVSSSAAAADASAPTAIMRVAIVAPDAPGRDDLAVTLLGNTTQPVNVVPERKPAAKPPAIGETAVLPVLDTRNLAASAPSAGAATAIVAAVPERRVVAAPAIPPATVVGQRAITPEQLAPRPPVPAAAATMVSPAYAPPAAPAPFIPPAASQGNFSAPTPFSPPQTNAAPSHAPVPRTDAKRSSAAGWLIWIGVLGLLCAGAAAWWVLKGSKELPQNVAPTPGAGQVGDVATPAPRANVATTTPSTPELKPPVADSAEVSSLDALSAKASAAFAAGDFVSPAGECAAFYYQQILAQTPEDAFARARLQETGDGAEAQIRAALQEGTQSKARAYLEAALVYFADRESFKRLKTEFDAQS